MYLLYLPKCAAISPPVATNVIRLLELPKQRLQYENPPLFADRLRVQLQVKQRPEPPRALQLAEPVFQHIVHPRAAGLSRRDRRVEGEHKIRQVEQLPVDGQLQSPEISRT